MAKSLQNKAINTLNRLPDSLRIPMITLVMGSAVKFAGTAKIRIEKLTEQEAVMTLKNRRKVRNHIGSIHAAAMALLAESATGFLVGMNIDNTKLPLMKTLHVDYTRLAKGDLTARAHLTPEHIAMINNQEKGEVVVPVTITDSEGNTPVECAMTWAWVTKRK